MPKHSRRYRQLAALVPAKPVDLASAIQTLKQFNNTRFDQSVEVHVRLGIDPKQADQMVRGSVVLPHGIGRTQRVAVFAKGELADLARRAGADIVGQEDLVNRVKEGWLEFDVCIATPDMMGLVGPLGRILGPRGLMPSPRAGTVTTDVARVVREYKAGKVEFKNDSGGNVHAVVGKLSFSEQQLIENIQTFLDYLNSLRPAAVRGAFIRSINVAATMSPAVAIAL